MQLRTLTAREKVTWQCILPQLKRGKKTRYLKTSSPVVTLVLWSKKCLHLCKLLKHTCLANFKGQRKAYIERGQSFLHHLAAFNEVKRSELHKEKQMSTIPQLNKLTLGPLLTTSKGAKQIQITNDGGPLIWTPKEYLEIPFEPSNFSDKESSRLSICFTPTPEIESFQKIFESWCVKALAIKSKEFLGTELTQEQIKRNFQQAWRHRKKVIRVSGRN